MTLPGADVQAAQAFLDVSEVEDGRVIMVVVVILEEMTRHILGGRFLEGPRLKERERIL
jgi:hypothetical protein